MLQRISRKNVIIAASIAGLATIVAIVSMCIGVASPLAQQADQILAGAFDDAINVIVTWLADSSFTPSNTQ